LSEAIREKIWIAKNDVDSQILCDVCFDDLVQEDEEGNPIDTLVMCDKCNVAVH
jgi:hypothetical protein